MAALKIDPEKLLSLADQKLFLWLNHARHPFLDQLMPYFSDERVIYAFFGFFALLFIFSLRLRGLIIVALVWLCIMGSDFLCGQVLKPYFKRPRPYLTLKRVYLYKHHQWRLSREPLKGKSYSFPSCHATNVACAASLFGFLLPRLKGLFWLFALAVAYSRIYLGVHYPFDVLAGLLTGLLVGYLGRLLLVRLKLL